MEGQKWWKITLLKVGPLAEVQWAEAYQAENVSGPKLFWAEVYTAALGQSI